MLKIYTLFLKNGISSPHLIIWHHFFLTPCRVSLSVYVKALVKPGFKTEDNYINNSLPFLSIKTPIVLKFFHSTKIRGN